MSIDELNITKHKQSKSWDLGNKILYDMCKNNFAHKNNGVIIAKVLFIGRIYAAAIERRKKKRRLLVTIFTLRKLHRLSGILVLINILKS